MSKLQSGYIFNPNIGMKNMQRQNYTYFMLGEMTF